MNHLKTLRNKRLLQLKLERGKIQKETLNQPSPYSVKIGLFIFALFFISLSFIHGFWLSYTINPMSQPAGYSLINIASEHSWFLVFYGVVYGLSGALVFSAIYFLIPVFKFGFRWITLRKIPPKNTLKDFNIFFKVITLLTFAAVIVYWVKYSPSIAQLKHIAYYGFSFLMVPARFHSFMITTLIIAGITLVLYMVFTPANEGKYRPSLGAKFKYLFDTSSFGIYLGQSTGILAKRHHGASIAASQPVVLSLEDAAQNIIVYGGIGEGKTTALIHPLLLQLLDQKCGGLIFDIKGNFKHAVLNFAKQTEQEITVIGVEQQKINLLHNLTPETAADYLRATLTLHGSGGGKEKHWLNAASSLAGSVLGVLSFIPKYYTLECVYKFLHEPEFKAKVQDQLTELDLTEKNKRLLDHYVHQYDTVFTGNNERYQKDVLATMNEVLSHFAHPVLADAFCSATDDMPDMLEVLNGKVFLVDLPLHTWGMGGNTVYMFIKLRYFDAVKRRLSNPELEQDKPVFFMCDEYQRLVDRSDAQLNADLNFWDTARSAKNIGIISTQSISSFYSAIGDDHITDAILQNFRQKICLKTEDKSTINNFEFILGKVEVGKRHFSKNNRHYGGIRNTTLHTSSSEGINYAKESVVDAQLYRTLEPDQAVASLIIKNRAMDDVLDLFPIRD
ncbi:MAG: TraM recognition domain-containing protein [Gammaproteobacteria bacterium]|nr:TraM recognition domain-containing protein [Gammaproteobacteria bacterium]